MNEWRLDRLIFAILRGRAIADSLDVITVDVLFIVFVKIAHKLHEFSSETTDLLCSLSRSLRLAQNWLAKRA